MTVVPSQAFYAKESSQTVPFFTKVLRMVIMRLIQAINATFLGFPAFTAGVNGLELLGLIEWQHHCHK